MFFDDGFAQYLPVKKLHHVYHTGETFKQVFIVYVLVLINQEGGLYTGLVQVLENLESPGNLLWHFPGLESPGKRPLVLESSGNLLNSAKKI